jgi:tripartite-type tricarboxylate transporter receptor subunit TctC
MKAKAIAFLICAGLATTQAFAQGKWPERTITLIVPTGAGSATDITARVMASEISKAVNGTVVVENIGGSSGIPAMRAAAQAVPDGYTFLFANSSGMSINAVSFKSLPYDPNKDYDAVAIVADLAPIMLSVHKDVPVKSLPELIAYVKANPGKVSYGVDATTGGPVFFGKMLNVRGKMDMAAVPYRTSAQMVQDAGQARFPVLVSSIAAAQPEVTSGNLRPIALFASRRFPTLPDLPTVAETLPGTDFDTWFSVVAPRGTPSEIVGRVNKAISDFLQRPETKERLYKIGLDMGPPKTPGQSAEYIRTQQEMWRKLAVELGVEPQ